MCKIVYSSRCMLNLNMRDAEVLEVKSVSSQ